MSGGLWAQALVVFAEKGMCRTRVLCGDLAFLPAGQNLPKEFVAFPPRAWRFSATSVCDAGTLHSAGRATRRSREGAAAFPTFGINFGLFFFFFLLI